MDATLYTGNGSTQTITNAAGFQPDLVWYKGRSFAYNHGLFDSVRGTSNFLSSNLTDAEISVSGVTAFNSNGFSLGSSVNGNGNTTTYVGWQWKANGAAVSNTSGTITSQVSANASAGFSIATYTGTGSAATVGHGLGVAPSFIIVKRRSATDDWQVYHAANTANPETDYLVLNTTAATADAADRWNDTAPTSSVFSIGNGSAVNTNAATYVAYCWSEIAGFSKFGSYTGNGSADGPFVYLGFRPAFLMIKRSDSTSNAWLIYDNKRNTSNLTNKKLAANLSDVENNVVNMGDDTFGIDFLSNGFKSVTQTGANQNASGGTYIYMAFAENPTKYSLAR
jgi:hypothetical protein